MRRFFLWVVALYLRFWARIALSIHRPQVVGIAGSAGKSSARNAVTAMLQNHVKVVSIDGNSETGLPLGLLGIKPGGYSPINWLKMMVRAPFGIFYLRPYAWAVCEYGIDEPHPPRNMEYLLTILRPDIAVHLNISATHTMQFEALLDEDTYKHVEESERHEFLLKRIACDDLKIITGSGARVGIYNRDDIYAREEVDKYDASHSNAELLSFGGKGDISYGEYQLNTLGTQMKWKCDGKYYSLSLGNYILPKVYQETIGASLLAAQSVGVEIENALKSFQAHFSLPPGRATRLDGVNDSVVIDSSYNASKESTLSFLDLLDNVGGKSRKKYFLFGDMRELGSLAKEEHVQVANKMAGIVDECVCVGSLTRKYVMPILKRTGIDARWFENSRKAGEYLRENLTKKSVVLVKGSQNTIFLEVAVEKILKNKSDVKKLCRQENYWMRIKKKYFEEVTAKT